MTITSSKPSYINLSGKVFTFNPPASIAGTTVTVNIDISDGYFKTPATFDLVVVNQPPVISPAPAK